MQKIRSKDSNKPFIFKPKEIADAFASFYKGLYSENKEELDIEEIDAYLKDIHLSQINIMDSDSDAPIAVQEINEAILQ